MDNNTGTEVKDGDLTRLQVINAPSVPEVAKKIDGIVKKKRRRGKSKRKITKPFLKAPWQDRRKYEKSKRNNRFRKIILAKTHAPFNNNQFLMEIHKPEPENNFQILRTPSARTRDSSFSVDSDENYFFSLPEDEEEYLTKEFSSVYEDAQSERLSNMSKIELIQEYLLLEAKYDNLIKRTERVKPKYVDDKETIVTDKGMPVTDKENMLTDKDKSGTSMDSINVDEPSIDVIMQKLKEQEDEIQELQLTNEKLKLENEHLRQRTQTSSSEDSESDSSSTSMSATSSSQCVSPVNGAIADISDLAEDNHSHVNGQNGHTQELEYTYPLVNGFHHSNESSNSVINEEP